MKKPNLNPFKKLYDEAGLLPVFRRSITFMILGNTFATVFGVICNSGSTAMVGLATRMGATDSTFGILAGIGQFAALLQIPFSLLVSRTGKRKKYLLSFGIPGRAIWILFGLIPFLVPETAGINLRLFSLIFLVGMSSCLCSMINVTWYPWFSDVTPETIRSRVMSIREIILCVVNIGLGFLIAYLLDHLPEETRYVIIFIIGGTFGVLDMICFAFCKEVPNALKEKPHLKSLLAGVFRNRPFMRFTVMWTLYCFACSIGTFMTPYAMNEMGLTNTQIMLFGTITASVASILFVPMWGKAIFRHGCKPVMFVAGIGASLTPLFFIFFRPGSFWPLMVYNFIGASFWSGSNLAAMNMQLIYSPADTRPTYLAVHSCMAALLGTALGAMLFGGILDGLSEIKAFPGFFDRYKFLFTLESVLRILTVLLFVPRFTNDKDGTPKQLIRAMLKLK